MASFTLKSLLLPKTGTPPVLAALVDALPTAISITAPDGGVLFGPAPTDAARVPILLNEETFGFVVGDQAGATAVAQLLGHLAAKESERRALAGEILHLYRELHLIEQLSEQLAALLEFEAVGESALGQARRLIRASHGVVLLRNVTEEAARAIASFGEPIADLAPEAALITAIADRGIADIDNSGPLTLIGAPLRAKQRTVGVIALASDSGTPYTAADLKLLNTIALQTAAAIENSLLCAEMVDAAHDRAQLAALQRELDTARTIQHSLVPRIFPPFPDRSDFDIHAQMTSAKAVGGDFFDFFLIDDHRLGIVIGDVSGKGIPAALYMAVTRTQIKTTALQGMAPYETLLAVNRVLVREKVSSMFATCLYAILDTQTGELQYCNAGHNPPFVLRASGELERTPVFGNLPLGLFGAVKYAPGLTHLHPGDSIFLYTDGIPEATNPAVEEFTEQRLCDLLRSTPTQNCRHLCELVSHHVQTFVEGAPQSDDITMLALRRH